MKEKNTAPAAVLLIALCTVLSMSLSLLISDPAALTGKSSPDDNETIKWVDFDVPYAVLKKAMDTDIATYNEKVHVNWIDVLAYLAAKYGGDFSLYNEKHMDTFVKKIKNGVSINDLTEGMEYYSYYSKAYNAILGNFLGEYQIRTEDEQSGGYVWKKAYGLKAFSPVADGFHYSDFDDFGQNRSYGYSRKHLGHDMMTSIGTPVVAVESGTVEALGWNQYGGWRIGIRTHDKKRYYYYAHLKKDDPYAENLYIGASVTAGDVIGYTGQTGYSIKENVNNVDTPHLHIGMQLIFDESTKDGINQIWINLYSITRLLSSHRCTVVKNDVTGEYERKYLFTEENYYLKELEASAKTADADEIRIPIIMYHSIAENNDDKNRYTVSPRLLEKDLKYIRKKGYTPVFIKDIIDFSEGKGDLPAKPIVITFDDGYYNNYYYAFPLLKKYGMKAVISIVGSSSDKYSACEDHNLSYSCLSWDDILEMHLSGYWEIQNHSYNCHTYENRNGVSQVSNETAEDYEAFLSSDIKILQEKIQYITGEAPNTFTYPFGAYSKNTDGILKKLGFKATLSCVEGVSTVRKGDPESLYRLKRYLRPPDVSPENFFTFLQ